jgi:nicotinamide riboside transporter PnuC
MGQHSKPINESPSEETVMKIFGREPSMILGLVAAAIQLLSAALLPLSVEQQGVLNAVAVAVMGLVTAWAVSAEKAAPAVLGLVQAVLAAALAFGLVLSPDTQSAVMAFVTAAVSLFVRQQVTAPVPADA